MTLSIIIQIIFLGIGLSADAFSVSLTDGLVYRDINKKKSFFIASMFAFMQAFMPLIGFWIVELVSVIAESSSGEKAGIVASTVVTWLAFGLLLVIGFKMLIESLIEIRKPKEARKEKSFSFKEVIFYSFATSIDALAAGVALHAKYSTVTTVWLHVSIIFVLTFLFSLIGLFLGKKIVKLLRGNYEVSGIIGGLILIVLAIWVVLSHYISV